MADYVAYNMQQENVVKRLGPIRAKTGSDLENSRLLGHVNNRIKAAYDLQSELRIQYDVENAHFATYRCFTYTQVFLGCQFIFTQNFTKIGQLFKKK